METGTRVQFYIFSKRCSYRIVRRQAHVFAILVQGQDNLAVEFSFEFVRATNIHGQFRARFLVKLCDELVRLSYFLQSRPGGEIKAKLQVNDGSDGIRFLDFGFGVACGGPLVGT